jgi:hypothetical protein
MSKGSGLIERFYNEVVGDGNMDLINAMRAASRSPSASIGSTDFGRRSGKAARGAGER